MRSRTLESSWRLASSAHSCSRDDTGRRRVEVWQARVEDLGNRIQRLGPINLAAIDEFKEQSERMASMPNMGTSAVAGDAGKGRSARSIRDPHPIQGETFRVDAGFKELFPNCSVVVAYLELTGEDLLDTGVTVMARPPGKRNSSIHLLSGGEKAH